MKLNKIEKYFYDFDKNKKFFLKFVIYLIFLEAGLKLLRKKLIE
jgi:hypothetical protein